MYSNATPPVQLARLAAADPGRRLLVDADAGRTWSRGEMYERTSCWADALDRAGVAAGDAVLTMLPTGAEAVAVWLGVGQLRAIEAPVNTQYRGDLLAYVVNDSTARVCVVDARYLDAIREVSERFDLVDHIIVVGSAADVPAIGKARISTAEDFLADATPGRAFPDPEAHDVAAIIYTSGTTGPSKGVVMPWGQLHATATNVPAPAVALGEDDCAYVPFPFYHVAVRCPLATILAAGGAIVLREKFSTSYFWSDVEDNGCTYGQLLAGMTQLLMQLPPRDGDATNPLRVVSMVPVASNYAEFESRFGIRIGTQYHMTEISSPLFTEDWTIHDYRSCGRPRPGVEVRLVDELDREVPAGEPGELIVRTSDPWTMNLGYWRKPEATVEAWRNGWFHTGDVFRKDEHGNYFFIDRRKDTIRRRGENISSLEVETLIGQHPDVVEVAAVGVASARADLGFTDEEVRVFVIGRNGLTADALLDFMRPRMPKFMIPRYIDIVGDLPRTPTLKVRKIELRDRPIGQATHDQEGGAQGRIATDSR